MYNKFLKDKDKNIVKGLNLFFDARYILNSGQDGISRYSTHLAFAVHALSKKRSDIHVDITFIISSPRQAALLPPKAKCITMHKPTSVLEPLTAIFLNKHKPDVVFSPMQTIGTLFKRYKIILTIHDLIYYSHRTPPASFSLFIKILWRLYHASFLPARIILSRADAVATVSYTTKDKIKKHKMTKAPVSVIPNAHNHITQSKDPVSQTNPSTAEAEAQTEAKLQEEPKTSNGFSDLTQQATDVIYMGSFIAYKRVHLLIKAISLLPNHTLHLLGRIDKKTHKLLLSIAKKQKSANSSQIHFYNGVTDQQYMQMLLSPTSIFASASIDEGYGIPVVEALSCGCPAVLSDIPAFREVAGLGGLYFQEENTESKTAKNIASAIKYLSQPHIRKTHATLGLKHISQFSWEDSGQRLLDLCIFLTMDKK